MIVTQYKKEDGEQQEAYNIMYFIKNMQNKK